VNERFPQLLGGGIATPILDEERVGFAEIGRTVRIGRAKIRQTIITIVNAVSAGVHDVAEKLVRVVNRSGGIVYEPRLAHPPFVYKSEAVGTA